MPEEAVRDGLHYEDVAAISAATFAALIIISVVIDATSEAITSHLDGKSVTHDPHKKRKIRAFQDLWRRFQSEVTTLGCLAFIMWVISTAGFFK